MKALVLALTLVFGLNSVLFAANKGAGKKKTQKIERKIASHEHKKNHKAHGKKGGNHHKKRK